ncbi:malolactic enzyme [Alloscardovia macacae]
MNETQTEHRRNIKERTVKHAKQKNSKNSKNKKEEQRGIRMTQKTAREILNDPFLNKGTAFTEEERAQLGLTGMLPAHVQTIDEQAAQAYAQMETKTSMLEKRLFLMEIFNTNRTLFYRMFSQHVEEFNPIVYDPTIAETIENYSDLFVDPQYAAYLDINHPENIEATLKNAAGDREIRLAVVTDAEGILGIGDWGTNGVDISVGKLMVYTAAAGIDPASVMPIVIDAGTNRQSLLDDPNYLGNHHERVRGEKYYDFIEQFVQTIEGLFPKLYLHWEDFGRGNAANILNTYKTKIPTFNDDIQGTGIVTLGGIFGALDITGEKLTDQVYLCYGGGTAGAGIASRVLAEMVSEGMPEEDAYKRFFMVDKQGLLFDDMDDLTDQQRPFAKKRSDFPNAEKLTDLLEVVKAVKPTILVGTSTQPKTFTKEIVEAMCEITERPIIFPISNPTKLAEASAEDLIRWSDGKAFVATGIPSDTVSYKGVDYIIGQANNALIYPGLGLGMLASEASLLTDEMIGAAAHSLSGIVNPGEPGAPVLPPFKYVADVSIKVAEAVAKKAQEQGLARAEEKDMAKAVRDFKWYPEYK